MSKIWKPLVAALLATAVAILVNVVSAPLVVPRKYYLIALSGLLGVITLTAIVGSFDSPPRLRKSQSNATPTSNSDVQVLEGARIQRRSQSVGWSLLAIPCVFSTMLTGEAGIAYSVGTSRLKSNIPMGLILIGFCVLSLAIALWVFHGVRTRLQFSNEGIILSDIRGKYSLRWTDATNFRTIRRFFSNFLVADPAPDSSWFIGPWKFDQIENVIKICNLSQAGIDVGKVDYALKYWAARRP
jgi:hypothetical protein